MATREMWKIGDDSSLVSAYAFRNCVSPLPEGSSAGIRNRCAAARPTEVIHS